MTFACACMYNTCPKYGRIVRLLHTSDAAFCDACTCEAPINTAIFLSYTVIGLHFDATPIDVGSTSFAQKVSNPIKGMSEDWLLTLVISICSSTPVSRSLSTHGTASFTHAHDPFTIVALVRKSIYHINQLASGYFLRRHFDTAQTQHVI